MGGENPREFSTDLPWRTKATWSENSREGSREFSAGQVKNLVENRAAHPENSRLPVPENDFQSMIDGGDLAREFSLVFAGILRCVGIHL